MMLSVDAYFVSGSKSYFQQGEGGFLLAHLHTSHHLTSAHVHLTESFLLEASHSNATAHTSYLMMTTWKSCSATESVTACPKPRTKIALMRRALVTMPKGNKRGVVRFKEHSFITLLKVRSLTLQSSLGQIPLV
jgi:hypothetical protein